MREKPKYFLLNNSYDFGRGICGNMAIDGSDLRFSSDRMSDIGCYMTRIFDSDDRGMVWHRLLINTEDCPLDVLRVTVYASDVTELPYKGAVFDIYDIFYDRSIGLEEKTEMFSVYEQKKVSGANDIFLHDVKGRYLWVLIELFGISGKPAVIKDIRVYLPAVSWIDNLPQIYRKSDGESRFLERYLGIFQTLYEDIENEIDTISERFDPECAESGFLEWLAEWLDISDCSVWEEDKLRKLLLMAVSLYRGRGTRESLCKAIELYTGEKPFIVENFSLTEKSGTDEYEQTLVPVYGSDPYKVFILVTRDVIKSDNDIDVIWRIAREMMPVTVDFELKVLEPYIFLGYYSYLGINTYLGKPNKAVIDGRARLSFTVLGS